MSFKKLIYKFIYFSALICVAYLLYAIFMPNLYPPIGEEIGKKFHFILGSGILTAVTTVLILLIGIKSSNKASSLTEHKSFHLLLNLSDWLVLIFVLYLLLNPYLTQAPATTNISVLVLLSVLYFNIRVLTTIDHRFPKHLIILLLLTGLGQVLIGLKQLYGFTASNHSLYKVTGSFGNPGPYGGFLAVIFSLAFYRIVNQSSEIKNKVKDFKLSKQSFKKMTDLDILIFGLSAITVLGVILVIPSTMSRTAWLAMIVIVTAIISDKYAFFMKAKRFAKRKPIIAAVCSIVILVLAVTILFYAYNIKRGSADGRLLLWKISSKIMISHPVTGTGIGKFSAAYGEEQAKYFASAERSQSEIAVAEPSPGAFNDFLQIGASLGVTGLAIFILLVIVAFFGYRNSKHKGLMYALIAMLVFGLASYPLMLTSFQMVFVILIAIGAGGLSWRVGTTEIGYKTIACVSFCMLVICAYCYATINRFENSYEEWRTVRIIYNMQNYKAAAKGFAELYPDLYEHPDFLFEYGRALNQTGAYAASNDILQKASTMICDPMIFNVMGNNYKGLGLAEVPMETTNHPISTNVNNSDNRKRYIVSDWSAIAKAEQNYLHAHTIVPNRIYPLYLLTMLYFESGQTEKAVQMADRVLNFKEKVPSQAIIQMKDKVRKIR